ncbi:MAG: 16S rRNA (guanine(527)-N(7))-methyltransferase RsmG [Bacteroidaceae bacterium]
MTTTNNNAQIIAKYFPSISEQQQQQFNLLYALYQDWNAKINVISRKDIDALYERHVLHSLGIAKFITFNDGTRILDVGTGGGFPGIPLAILFPHCQFTLIDSIGKKINVATNIVHEIKLSNVILLHENAKEEKHLFDFVVTRAVMNTSELIKLIRKNIAHAQLNDIANGLICLKGGNLEEETSSLHHKFTIKSLSDYFDEDFFETKKILYIPI